MDTNPRYKYDNILATDLDMPEKTTQEFAGPGMKSRVDQILAMDINGDDGDDVTFNAGTLCMPCDVFYYSCIVWFEILCRLTAASQFRTIHGNICMTGYWNIIVFTGDAIPSPYLSYEGGPAGAPDVDRSSASRSAGASSGGASRPKTGKKTSSKTSGGGGGGSSAAVADSRDYNNYSASNANSGGGGGAYYSGSGAAAGSGGSGGGSGSSSRPKSATRRSASNEAAANAAYRVQDEPKGRYGNDEDLYPTARGLIKK